MFKNFIHTLSHYKLSSTLNIFGLSIAFAAFIIIMMQVRYEISYGTDDPNHAEIFRLETPSSFAKGKWTTQIQGYTAEHLRDAEPHIKGIYLYDPNNDINIWSTDSTKARSTSFYTGHTLPTTVFHFEFIEGSQNTIDSTNNVIISETLAKSLFPNQSALGETVNLKGKYFYDDPQRIVVGVYKDFVDNSLLQNGVFGSSNRKNHQNGHLFDANIYVRCLPSDTAQIFSNLRNLKLNNSDRYISNRGLRMTNAADIYYTDDVSVYGGTHPGNRSTTKMMLAISLLVILIAIINFTNFSTALAPIRIKGLNTRLVFGKQKSQLRTSLIFEAFATSIISFGIALLIVYGFNTTTYASLIRTSSTALSNNLTVVIGTGALAIITGILAGIYPAFYSTSFAPALVLKGSGMGSRQGQWLRSILIGFQFVVSIALITASLFITLQNKYLREFPTGFEKENTFVLPIHNASHNQRLQLTTKLQKYPAFGDITYSGGTLGNSYGMGITLFKENTESGSYFNVIPVYYNFMQTFKIPIIQGRDFSEGDFTFSRPDQKGIYFDKNQSASKIIVNRRAAELYNIKVDSIYNNSHCIGICENLNTRSLYNAYEPMAFIQNNILNNLYIRLKGGDTKTAYSKIEQAFKDSGIESDFECKLLTDTLNEQYAKEENLSKLVNLFSLLAIILSLVGVFGLVVFENQYRRKEIGLRKVYGSTTSQILIRFNRKFLILTGICFVIATPITYYAINLWLSTFAFHIPIYWWVFVAGAAIVATITIITITAQSFHTANENPTKSIQNN